MPNPAITSSYAGTFAGRYIAAALLSANTIEKGGLTVMGNIKYKSTIKKGAIGDIVKDAECDFTAVGEVTLTDRTITPEEFQVNMELCKKEFRSDFEAESMGYSVHDNLPPTFSEWLISYVLGKVAQKNELNIWQGVNATSGEFDGFQALFTAAIASGDIPAGNVVGTPLAIDASNVVTELARIIDLCPDAIYAKEDLKLYVPINVWKAYTRALGGFAAAGVGAAGYESRGNNQGYDSLMFDGVELFLANGLEADKCVLTTVDNLFYGTGLMNDQNEVLNFGYANGGFAKRTGNS